MRPLLMTSTALALVANLLTQAPALAAPVNVSLLQPQKDRSVPAAQAPARPANAADPAAAAALRGPRAAVAWPAAGTAVAGLPPAAATPHAARAGSLPVLVDLPSPSGSAQGDRAASGSAASVPGQVRVDMLDHGTAARAGVDVVMRVGRADQATAAGRIRVSLDYSGFRNAYGADWSSRLRLVRLPECALSTPSAPSCRPSPLPSTNTVAAATLAADVSLPAASTALVAAVSDPSGGAGDYTASKLSPSSTWEAGSSSGDFTWSYPMRVPASLGGPAPQVGLSYDAQSVDGHTAASNNQPSWVGEGFDYNPGSISRGYKACTDDMGGSANNSAKTGDLCWGTPNATMTLSGHSGELIRDDATGAWHLKNDDGTRIEALTGASNGDNNGEYWRVTTTDGTQYYFGLNHLSGWSSGKPETGSVYYAPVFGNNPGEPCNASSFASSWCMQAWQWNLDYVVDQHGNTESFWYKQETNNYARDNDAGTVSTYVRGGYLDRIDYGTDNRSGTDSEFAGTPPMRVVFHTDERCLPGSTCDSTHPASWPDVPWDQNCSSTTSCTDGSATFWTQKRLSSVTTQVLNPATGKLADVEQWTLNQTYPDPGDGTRAGLWLAGISHKGLVGGTATVPDVTFTGYQMANRVNTADPNGPPMKWWRISYINTETGGIIGVTYYPAECATGGTMPASADTNTKRCFPAYWTRPGATAPTIDWFQKYVVHQVTETDAVGGSPRVVTTYDYPNPPAWHYDSDDGLVPNSRKTWGQWRGYDQVNKTVGDPGEQTYTVTRYFRGMDGDHLSSGTRAVTVDGIADDDAYSGLTRQTTVYNGPGGAEVSAAIHTPWKSGARSTRTIAGVVQYARLASNDAVVQSRTDLDGGRSPRTSTVTTTFDGTYGYPTQVADNGDDAVAVTDDRCTITTHADNTGAWLIGAVTRVQQYALPCGRAPSTPDDVISDTRTSYDGLPFGTAPTKGDVTQTETVKAWSSASGSTYLIGGKAGYDPYGRLVDSWDVRGNKTHTAYTPATGGPVTQVVSTAPLGWTSTTDLDPLLGEPVDTVDVNGQITTVTYDPLGRLTAVWQPGQSRAAGANPNSRYGYTVSTNGSAVATSTLNAAGNYVTSYELYDGLLRPRQTQSPAAVSGTGRVLTDTFYNTAGQAVKANSAYYNTDANPGTSVFTPQDNRVPSQTVTSYDGAGRVTAQILKSNAVEQWRTSTTYGGDYTSVTPPSGGTPTSTVTDARGMTTELRQYHGTTPGGAYDSTRYQYDRKGQLQAVTDPAGNSWTYAYDVLGRAVSVTDPDTGTGTFSYNDAGDLLSTTDGRATTLAYSYDSIGRQTGEYDTSTSGIRLAGWTYDTVLMPDGTTRAKGQPASASRYVAGNAYTETVRGYTARYQPTGMDVVIPSAEGGLGGTYTVTYAYNVDASLNSLRIPASGGLGAETLMYGYDATTGLPNTLRTTFGGVTTPTTLVSGTAYTPFGEPSVTSFSTGGPIAQQGLYYEEATRRLNEVVADRETAPSYVADVHYTYDHAGNVTQIADTPAGGTSDTQCFTNDYLGRLTQAWTPATGGCAQDASAAAMGGPAPYWQTWTIDSAGNRTTQTDHNTGTGDVTTTYTYPAAGAAQPHTVSGTSTTDTAGTRAAAYSYDPAGETKTRPGPHGQQALDWDLEGHLSTLTDSAGANSYVYDAAGARLISHDPTGATLNLGVVELRLAKGATTPTETRYYTFNGQTVAQRTSAGVTWLLGDPHGTADTTIDSTTQAVTHRRFTPYGNPRGTSVPWANDKGFLGGIQDPTGLTHEGAREYDPTTGRFISADPVFEAGDPQQMGGYAYAANSPVTSADPSGLMLPAPDGNGTAPPPADTATKIYEAYQGFKAGARDGVVHFFKNLGHTVAHPMDAVSALVLDERKWGGDTTDVSGYGWWCAITGACDAVSSAVAHARAGDYYGAGYVSGDYASQQATGAAVTAALTVATDGVGAALRAVAGRTGGALADASEVGDAAAGGARAAKTDPAPPAPPEPGGAAADPSPGGGEPAGGSPSGGGQTPATGAGEGTKAVANPSKAGGGRSVYMKPNDPFAVNHANARPLAGYHDVVAHGSPNSVTVGGASVDHRVLANLVTRDPNYTGGPIRLCSCSTGALDDGFAQNLANKMGVNVLAPADKLWAFPSGTMAIGPSRYNLSFSSGWRLFRPGNR